MRVHFKCRPWRPYYIAIMIKLVSNCSLPLASELSVVQQALSLLWMEMHSDSRSKKSVKQDVKYQPSQSWTNGIWFFSLQRKQCSDKHTAVPAVWSFHLPTCQSAVKLFWGKGWGEGQGHPELFQSKRRTQNFLGLPAVIDFLYIKARATTLSSPSTYSQLLS